MLYDLWCFFWGYRVLVRKLVVCCWCGCLNMVLGVFCLIICFWFIIMMWLVMWWVKFNLWVIIISVVLEWVSFLIILSILVISFGFSVEVGLLNSSIFGCSVSVWVIVMCCCWLLDSWCGNVLVLLVRLICFSSVCVCCLVCVCGMLCIVIGVLMMFFNVVRCGNRLKFWNIMFILVC